MICTKRGQFIYEIYDFKFLLIVLLKCSLYFLILGIHYLHSEAPVKVIHRDLKSRNGNGFFVCPKHIHLYSINMNAIFCLN